MRAAVIGLAALLALGPPTRALAQGSSEFDSDESEDEGPPEPDALGPPVLPTQQDLSGAFYAALSPYGRWEQDPHYGWIWLPSDPAYRPYSEGRWVYTSEGWAFEGAEPFGWVVDHYGRWLWLSSGWAWVPGYVWSPAWVEFRSSPGYIGWCPLGPGDFAYGFSLGAALTPWLFVSVDLFGAPLYPSVFLTFPHAHRVFGHSHFVPSRRFGHGRAFFEVPGVAHGPPVAVQRPPRGFARARPRAPAPGASRPAPRAIPPAAPRPESGGRGGSGAVGRPSVASPPPAARPAPAPHPVAPPASRSSGGGHGGSGRGWIGGHGGRR